MKKSRVGKEQKIIVDGQEKMVPHDYFFTMYNAKGEDIGQNWMRTMRPSDQEKKAYKLKYGHDHPITLPVRKKKK